MRVGIERPARRSIIVTAVLAWGISSGSCGRPEPRPAVELVPDAIAVIETADVGGGETALTIEGGVRLQFRWSAARTLETTGQMGPGHLLLYSADRWAAVLAPLEPPEVDVGPAWLVRAPAWVDDTAIVFDSGLRLAKHQEFVIDPSIRQPSESGYTPTGTFLVSRDGVVLEMR